jgi:hypothetical protein
MVTIISVTTGIIVLTVTLLCWQAWLGCLALTTAVLLPLL